MRIPFFEELEKAQNVLIAGAGGGFDVFCGLPLFSWLKRAGKTVHLANLSFTQLSWCEGVRPVSSILRVLPGTVGPYSYFPEAHLSAWLSDRFGETPIYAIEQSGVRPVTMAHAWLAEHLGLDTVILIDGGTDSLMRGDEVGLGTPQEDMASIAAVDAVSGVARKFLVCLGFGVDAFHGVCHAHFLENASAIIAAGGYLGAWSLMRDTADFELYREAVDYVCARTPRRPSIVNTSIIAAVHGSFGDHHSTKRTEGSNLFINPLMGLYWAFRLEQVVQRNLYLDQIRETNSYFELCQAIECFSATRSKVRPWQDIPC